MQFYISWVLSTILCINLGNFFSNMYLIYIFVIKKYYIGSKLLKLPIFEKLLTRIPSKNEVKCLVG